MNDPLREKQIKEKIEILFSEENFYFYDANAEDIEEEENEVKRIISDCMAS
jgi:hypothetical protein